MLIGNALLKLKTTVCASWKILKKKSFRYDLLVVQTKTLQWQKGAQFQIGLFSKVLDYLCETYDEYFSVLVFEKTSTRFLNKT